MSNFSQRKAGEYFLVLHEKSMRWEKLCRHSPSKTSGYVVLALAIRLDAYPIR